MSSTLFWQSERRPKCRLNIWGDKIKNASQYPKYWDGDNLVDNPFYAETYLPFFEITHKSKEMKWGMSYSWVISLNGEVILTRNAGLYDATTYGGSKTTAIYYDVDDGMLPRCEQTTQRDFHTDLMQGGFSLDEINKLRTALGLSEVEDFVKY